MPAAFNILVEYIEEYESDTFSASGSQITHEEATRIADTLIQMWMDRHIDGVILDELLDDIRPSDIL